VNLAQLAVKRPVGVIMMIFGVLVLGIVSLKNLAVDLYPKIEVPVAVITTTYQGASPQEIERLVSEPIESVVGSIQGIDKIQSVSSPNSSLVIMQFDWGTNIDNALNDIRERIDQVAGMLPEDADRPSVLRIDPQQTPVMWIGLSGAAPEKLQDIAKDEIEPYFERVDGVASISTQGGKEREIRVEIDQARLNSYGLSAAQLVEALRSENQAASAGNLEKGSQELQVRIDGEFTEVEDIQKTPIQLKDGRTIELGDVAEVKDTFKDLLTTSRVNHEPALVLSVLKQSDANAVKVADGMYEAIDEMQKNLKKDGISLSIILDTSDFIRQSIDSVVDNIISGAVLSTIILLFFLKNIRAMLVIGLTIPIGIIATFSLMYFTGETLNILSMGGLALGIGMMVDSAIVIMEHIFSLRQKGVPLQEAAIQGGSELAPAVIASTLTSVVVFAPIVFVEGLAAELFRPLALTVSFSQFASLAAALTLVPMLSARLLKNVKTIGTVAEVTETEEKTGRFKAFIKSLRSRYSRFLQWALNHRKTVLLTIFLLIIGSFGLVPFIGTSFIPPSDQGQISLDIVAREGVQLKEMESIVDEVDKKLKKYDDTIETSYVTVGGNNTGFGTSVSNEASYIIQLVEADKRNIDTTAMIKKLEKELKDIPGAEFKVGALDPGFGSGAPVDIKISGPNLDVLKDLAQQVTWIVEDVKGTYNIDNTVAEGRPEIKIKVKRDLVSQYGLSYQQVMNEIKLGFDGQVATRYRTDGNEYDVRVLLPEDKRRTIRDLESMTIRSNTGIDIPLSAVAELKQVQGPAEINRDNQQRQVSVTSDIRDRDLGSINNEIKAKIDQLAVPEGYRISTGGQGEDMAESFKDLSLALILSIFLVYLVMAVQFESFAYPFVIMFSLPTTIIGVLVGLFITQKPLSVPAFIGIIMLAGIVVNNGIILVEYINILRQKGFERMEAIIDAGLSRIRPILMTALSTILGMVPLALGIGEGAEAQAPMAVVIIFGLTFSTIFTLVLVPVVYTLIDDFGSKMKHFRFRRKPAEEVELTQ
jgi:hydrophobic/amphiphilic exporter-1 (mainly G- bacteria), HAE1 family